MTLALATSWIDAAHASGDASAWLDTARALDVRGLFVQRIPAHPAAVGTSLRAAGVRVEAAAAEVEHLATHVEATARLRAVRVVVEGGPVGRHGAGLREAARILDGRAFAGRAKTPEDDAILTAAGEDRASDRAARTETLLRALHPLARAGAPLAVRNAGAFDQLLGLEEAGWVLDELPGLGVCLDVARVVRAQRAGWGATLDDWLEAHAGRVVAVVATGLGRDGQGRRHPEDGTLPWSTLSARVPRAAPWIFDPAPDLGADEVQDALRALRALRR